MEGKKLYKSSTDKKIAGVCGGIAEYAGRKRCAGLYHCRAHHAGPALLSGQIKYSKQ